MFQKGPGEGYGAWGKEEVLKRFPEAVCRKVCIDGHRPIYRVVVPKSCALGVSYSARDAWCDAATILMNGEQ